MYGILKSLKCDCMLKLKKTEFFLLFTNSIIDDLLQQNVNSVNK